MANNIKLETLYMSGNFPNMVSLAFAKVLLDNLDIKFIKETNNTKKLNMEFKLPNYTLVSNYWEKEVISIMMPKIIEKFKAEMKEYYTQEEDVLSYALFNQVAINFFKYRLAKEQKVDADLAKSTVYPV